MEIRKLKRRDRVTLTEMIRKLAEKVGDTGILDLMVSDPSASGASAPEAEERQNDGYVAMGIKLFRMMYEQIDAEFTPWLADMAGMDAAAFDDAEFGIEIDIIDAIIDMPEFGAFFTNLSRLVSKTKAFAAQLKGARDQ